LVVTGDLEELRSLTEEILAKLDRWPSVLEAVPVVRALAAAGETQLLARTAEAIRETSADLSANAYTAVLAAEGLLSLLQGRAGEAVEQLEAAIKRERELGRTCDAACIELDLARALEAAGETAAAKNAKARAAAVLEPLGCVNPF
jgi:tetratricopeptide (TPR) repeat protein